MSEQTHSDVIKQKVKEGLEAGVPFDLKEVWIELILDAVTKAGGDLEEDLDTNGWQVDWWKEFTFNGQKWMIEGGAWYGTAEFWLHDDEKDTWIRAKDLKTQ